MIDYNQTDLFIAVLGLLGIISTAVIITYSTVQNRKEEIKLKRIRRTRAFDQDILG